MAVLQQKTVDNSQWIVLLKQHNEQAFRELVLQFQPLVIRTCIGFLHDEEEARDVAQDVFVEVYRSIDRFREESSLSTWLYRIAVNYSLNRIRSQKSRPWFRRFMNDEGTTVVDMPIMAEGAQERPDELMEQDERKKILYQAIGTLPENQRVALTLHKFEEMSYKEIAGVMEISLSAVESLIHRAKKRLQKQLIKSLTN
jgi:RNA polymerase sigma-70 factor (ECF subfamily)